MLNLQTLSGPVVVLLMLLFFGGSLYMSLRIRKRTENADGFMTGGGRIGFGISAASMTATWPFLVLIPTALGALMIARMHR